MASTLLIDLKSYWKLDEVSGNAEDSLGDFHLRNYGATPGESGKINTGYHFFQTASQQMWGCRLTSQAELVSLNSFTISAWINRTNSGERQKIFSIWNDPVDTLALEIDNHKLILHSSEGNTQLAAGDVPHSQWVHIAVTFQGAIGRPPGAGSYRTTGYINGAAQNQVTVARRGFRGRISIGGSPFSGDVLTFRVFRGLIDEVGLWRRELTSDEITELYAAGDGNSYPFEDIPTESEVANEYGEKYYCLHHAYTEETLTVFRIEIHERNYSGGSSEVIAHSEVFRHEYEQLNPENIFEFGIQKARFEFMLLVRNENDLDILRDIFEADEEKYKIVKKVNNVVEWQGFVLPGMLEYDEIPFPLNARISAKDFSVLESKTYPLKTTEDLRNTVIQDIAQILRQTGFYLDINVYTDWSNEDIDEEDDILNQLRHDTYHLRVYGNSEDLDEKITMFQALEYMLKPYSLMIRQQNGVWDIFNVSYIAREGGTVKKYVYDYSGDFVSSSVVNLVENLDNTTKFINFESVNRFLPAAKTIDLTYSHKSNSIGLRVTNPILQTFDGLVQAGSINLGDLDQLAFLQFSIIANVNLGTGLSDFSEDKYAYFYIRTDNYYFDNDPDIWEWTETPTLSKAKLRQSFEGTEETIIGYFSTVRARQVPAPPNDSVPSEGPLRVVLAWADDPIGTRAVSSISWSVYASIVSSLNPENLALFYRITQSSVASRVKNLGSSIYGVGPISKARSGIYTSNTTPAPGGDHYIEAEDNFYIIGDVDSNNEYNTYDPLALVLKEVMDLLRNASHVMDFVFYGPFTPQEVLNYKGDLFFFLSGVQSGRENKWQSSNFLKLNYVTSSTDIIEVSYTAETQGGGVGGNGGGSSAPGTGGPDFTPLLETKVDKDGGDEQLIYYPDDLDSAGIWWPVLTDDVKMFAKTAWDRLAELITQLIETKVDEDGGDEFLFYYPTDPEFWEVSEKLTLQEALDFLANYLMYLEFPSGFQSGSESGTTTIEDNSTYDLEPLPTDGDASPLGIYLLEKPQLIPHICVDGIIVILSDDDSGDCFWGTEESSSIPTPVAFADLVGNEQLYWNASKNAARGTMFTFGDLQSWNRIHVLHARCGVVVQLEAPVQGTPTVDSYQQITVNWTDTNSMPNEEGYEVQYDTVNTFDNDPQSSQAAADATSLAISGLSAGTTYYFRVRALGDDVDTVDSEWSNIESETTELQQLTAPVQSAPTVDSFSAITVNYTDPNSSPNEEEVEVQYDTVNTFDSSPQTSIAAANSTSHQITGLSAGTTYYFRVRAVGDDVSTADSEWSNIESETTALQQLTAPVQSAPTVNDFDSITVNYTDPNTSPNEVEFDVQYDTVNTFDNAPVTVQAPQNSTSFEVTGLTAETTYYFRIRAVGNGTSTSDSEWSNIESETTDVMPSESESDSVSSLLSGLISYYSFEETSGDLIDQHGVNDGTVSGPTREETGVIGDSYFFDGSNDEIAIDGIDLSEKSFSISVWLAKDNNNTFLRQSMSTTTNNSLHVGFVVSGGGTFRFDFLGNTLQTESAYASTDWHHWVCVYDAGTGQRRIYRDGVEVASGSSGSDYLGTGTMYIGRPQYSSTNDRYQGHVDELGFWERVLTEQEIIELYNSGNGNAYPF